MEVGFHVPGSPAREIRRRFRTAAASGGHSAQGSEVVRLRAKRFGGTSRGRAKRFGETRVRQHYAPHDCSRAHRGRLDRHEPGCPAWLRDRHRPARRRPCPSGLGGTCRPQGDAGRRLSRPVESTARSFADCDGPRDRTAEGRHRARGCISESDRLHAASHVRAAGRLRTRVPRRRAVRDRRAAAAWRFRDSGAPALPGVRRQGLLPADDGRRLVDDPRRAEACARTGRACRRLRADRLRPRTAAARVAAGSGRKRLTNAVTRASQNGRRRRARASRPVRDSRNRSRIQKDDRLSAVHPRRRDRDEAERMVRRPRAARHSCDRLSRRPGAQSHAVRAADDPDQPRDHRRGRAGRAASPGIPARCDLRRRHGPRLRRARPHRHPHGWHVRNINSSPWFNLGIAVAVRGARIGDVRRPDG